MGNVTGDPAGAWVRDLSRLCFLGLRVTDGLSFRVEVARLPALTSHCSWDSAPCHLPVSHGLETCLAKFTNVVRKLRVGRL